MGTNQSTNTKNTEENKTNDQTSSGTRKGRLTYQESFDIRTKAQIMSKRVNNREEMTSLSSNSDSELHSGYSYSSRKKIKRNRSKIVPPLLLYTNQNKLMDYKQKRENFNRKKSMSSASENSQNTASINMAENSSFDNTDIEEEINLILNDPKGNEKPWYRDPNACSSSSTVSPIKSDKRSSSAEELYSSKSLPTPSFYLYLTFDVDANKKSKSIEVLDDPCYFFLNYDDDTSIPMRSDNVLSENEN